jgi:hypothetical protein
MLGEVGDGSLIHYGEACPACGRQPPRTVQYLDYRFDAWAGEDLVCTGDEFAVTPALRSALESAGIEGVTFRSMSTSKSEMFATDDQPREVPEFSHMVIEHRCSGPSGWWELKGVCPRCRRPNWEHTDRVGEALTAAAIGATPPPRLVYADSWHGEDVFMLDDPGPPLATERFVKALSPFNTSGLVFSPARWMSR